MSETIRVFLVSNVRLYREGLGEALRARNLDVVGSAGADHGLESVAVARPDVVLVTTDPRTGAAEIRRVVAAVPAARVVALAVPDAEGAIIACAEAGAAGFVTIEESLDDLAEAIENAACNQLACSPRITAALVRRIAVLAGERPSREPAMRLTPREAEISEFLGRGLSNKEIATRLHIEVATVKNHVHNILEKLGLSRRTQVAQCLERLERTAV